MIKIFLQQTGKLKLIVTIFVVCSRVILRLNKPIKSKIYVSYYILHIHSKRFMEKVPSIVKLLIPVTAGTVMEVGYA